MMVASLCFWTLLAAEGVILQDGKEVSGRVVAFANGGILVEGQADPIPVHELNAVVLRGEEGSAEGASAPKPADLESGPMARFRDGETLRCSVLSVKADVAVARATPPASSGLAPLELRLPLEVLKGFRLQAAPGGDDVFEKDLAEDSPRRSPSLPTAPPGSPPETPAEDREEGGTSKEAERTSAGAGDVVYVRRPEGALRVDGLLRSMDQEYLSLEIDGKPRRIRRSLVVGVILGPVASTVVESDVPAVVDLAQGDQIPAFLREIRGESSARNVAIRFRGSRSDEVEEIPEGWIRRIRFSSDRVVFLSDIQPVMVDEAPLLGTRTTFPWRRDLAASGSPLRIGGRSYRKGIGVHARSVLEFDLGARFRSLAGTIGLDETAGAEAGVKFRVFADGKELYSKGFLAGDPAGNLSLPVDGVNRLRLEVDFGDDGVDFGDHADWADLRVTR